MPILFTLDMPPRPAPCRAAAASLRSIARTASSTSEFVEVQATLPHSVFSGAAARSYRAASADLGADIALLGSDVRALAAELETYADRIQDVRRVLAQVGRRAVAERLVLAWPNVVLPECPDPAQRFAYERLRRAAEDASAARDWANEAWATALGQHTGQWPEGALPVCTAPPPGWPPEGGEYPFDPRPPAITPVGPIAPEPPWRSPEVLPDRDPVEPDRTAPVDRPVAPVPPPPDGAQPQPTSEPEPADTDVERDDVAHERPHREADVGFLFTPEVVVRAGNDVGWSCGYEGVLS
jgi:hypothetical protein